MPDKPKSLNQNDWKAIGEWIKAEKERRKARRADLELNWNEVDRQVALQPLARKIEGSNRGDWYPELESPTQFNTLEVLAADARRLKFPFGTAWYEASAELDDEYMDRFEVRRFAGTAVGVMLGLPEDMAPNPMTGGEAVPMKLDQETADTLVHAVLDYYHRLYDFRAQCDLLDIEALKYGTFVGRVREVSMARFTHDFRGLSGDKTMGPALIPCSIKNVYLDDAVATMMHEGVSIGPSFIRCYYQYLEDLKRAARAGGAERGWLMDRVKRLEPIMGEDDKRGQIELLEFEGDLIVPKSRDPIFMPNVVVTVACGSGEAWPIRFRTNTDPFRSYVVGHYMRDSIESPYGTSPLIKGQPLAEAIASVLNDLMAASLLNCQPPVAWDKNDPGLAAAGGPEIRPGAVWGVDTPKAIEVFHQIGRPAELMQVYLALTKQYEDVVGVNPARREGEVKSHTTAYQTDVQAAKGMSRTEDFVQGQEKGPMTSILYLEYAIAKRTLKKALSIPVDAKGIDGWVTIDTNDLPENVHFIVNGSAGVLQERERNEQFMVATKSAVELSTASIQQAMMAQQAGLQAQPVLLDYQQIISEVYTRAGEQNPSRYIAGLQGAPVGTALPAPVPGAVDGAGGPPGAVPMAPEQGFA